MPAQPAAGSEKQQFTGMAGSVCGACVQRVQACARGVRKQRHGVRLP